MNATVELSADEKAMLDAIPPDGRAIGNGRLRDSLKWEAGKYAHVRKGLLNKTLIRIGRGRGGSVSRVATTTSKPPAAAMAPKVKEKDLYPAFRKAVETWAADQGWTDYFVEHKASQGKRDTGGMWTRPDFVAVGHKKYEYTPGVVRDIETFEVKTSDFTIDAVFETASHSRFATKSYLAVAKPDGTSIDEQFLSRVESECQRFGIGFLLFGTTEKPSDWEWRVEAARKEPDPEDVEQYIEDQFDSEHKKQMRNWF
jgi:hypothetical protein